jgi:hypothetical protein
LALKKKVITKASKLRVIYAQPAWAPDILGALPLSIGFCCKTTGQRRKQSKLGRLRGFLQIEQYSSAVQLKQRNRNAVMFLGFILAAKNALRTLV